MPCYIMNIVNEFKNFRKKKQVAKAYRHAMLDQKKIQQNQHALSLITSEEDLLKHGYLYRQNNLDDNLNLNLNGNGPYQINNILITYKNEV